MGGLHPGVMIAVPVHSVTLGLCIGGVTKFIMLSFKAHGGSAHWKSCTRSLAKLQEVLRSRVRDKCPQYRSISATNPPCESHMDDLSWLHQGMVPVTGMILLSHG